MGHRGLSLVLERLDWLFAGRYLSSFLYKGIGHIECMHKTVTITIITNGLNCLMVGLLGRLYANGLRYL